MERRPQPPVDVMLRLQDAIVGLLDPTRPLEGALECILAVAREEVGMDAAFLTELTDEAEVVRVVEGDVDAFGLERGHELRLEACYSRRLLTGAIPPLAAVVDGKGDLARLAPSPRTPGSYLAVPVEPSREASPFGVLGLLGTEPRPHLNDDDVSFLRVIARAIARRLEQEPVTVTERRHSEAQIRRVLDDGGPLIVFQPIVDLDTGEAVGFEALSRFPGSVDRPPVAWFSEAVSCGLGLELEQAALLATLARLHKLPDGVYLSVNLSPNSLLELEVGQLLHSAPGERLVVEITEHAPVSDYERVAAVADRLRRTGVRLAIDDAGAGFASMRHVISLRPELIKLDVGLVRGIERDPLRKALAASLVAFAAAIGSSLVAEGVETWAEATTLRELGVPYGQGFLFGEPSTQPSVRFAPRH